ncbi:MAG: glutamine-synthetase adenylyltransferase, partial [Rhodobacterales bacterium]
MSLSRRITRQPIAFDPAAAADLASSQPDLGPEVMGLLAATAGCSPYLRGLALREVDWLDEAAADPEAALEAVLAAAGQAAPDVLPAALRVAKRRTALLAALCDLGGVWPLEAVTGALTRLADRAVHLALTVEVAEAIRRGKLPGATPEDAATSGGMVALAMGKMGAGELN